MIDPIYLALVLAFLSGFLAGQLQSMLMGGDHYAAALAGFCAIIILIAARRMAR